MNKYSFKQIDSFSQVSCLYEVINIETNEPVTVIVFGYYSNKECFYICQAGALWMEKNKNFGTKNRVHNSKEFKQILKEMIDLFNLLGTDFVKPEWFPESFISERIKQQDPIYLYSSEIDIDVELEYNKQILTHDKCIDDLIEDGTFEFVYAEYYDDDKEETCEVDSRYELLDKCYECYDDIYFEIVYENL